MHQHFLNLIPVVNGRGAGFSRNAHAPKIAKSKRWLAHTSSQEGRNSVYMRTTPLKRLQK